MNLMLYGLPDIAAVLATIHALISVHWVHFFVVYGGHNLEPLNLMFICNDHGFSPMALVFYGLPDIAALHATSCALISTYCVHFVAVQRSQSETTWNLMCVCNVRVFLLMGLIFYELPDLAALLATIYVLI